LEDAIQPCSSFACCPPARSVARRKMWCTPCRTLQLLPATAALQCELDLFRRSRAVTHAEVPCGPGQSKCSYREMLWQGSVVRLGECDPAQQLLRLPSPRSARGSERYVVHPMPHFAASARCRNLEVCVRSVPKVAGSHTCRISVWPWTIEMLFACLPPAGRGARRKLLCAPCLTLQLLPTSAVFK
jgi:hypothetical protein